jgi:hypothetical protein
MTSRFLKCFGILWLAMFVTLSTGIAVGAKKRPPRPKDLPTGKGKEGAKDKAKAKDSAKAKENAKAKDNAKGKDNSKPITKDRKLGSDVAGVLYGSAAFTTLVALPLTTKTKNKNNCPPPRGNPSPGTPKTNPPCP